MASRIHTAVGELQRTAIDALRGLGLSFSLADRGTHALTWTEAVHGCGLRIIGQNEQRIREAVPRSFGYSERTIRAQPCSILDATGKSVLETGPRAFDLADAQAKMSGLGLAMVRGTFGTTLLGEFVTRSVERGLASLLLCQPSEVVSAEPASDRCNATLAFPDGTMKMAATASTQAEPVATSFAPLLAEVAGDDVARELATALERSGIRAGFSDVMLISVRAPKDKLQAWSATFDHCAASAPGWQVDDRLSDRWQNAVNNGFEVDPQDWKLLYALVAQTRAVTSERSQSQAG
jgi:hypothetical protein